MHEDYTPDTDTWTEVIRNYLKNIAFDGDVTTHEVLNLALEIDPARQTKALQMRAVLTSIGYKKVRRNVDGVRNYVWVKDPTAQPISENTEVRQRLDTSTTLILFGLT